MNLSHRKEEDDDQDSKPVIEEPKLENIINYCEQEDFGAVERPTETAGQNTEESDTEESDIEEYNTGCEVDDDCQKGEVCREHGECGMF